MQKRLVRQSTTEWGQGYSLEDWYQWYLSEEVTPDVMDNLTFAWFPGTDIIRLVKDLTDFPFSPENVIVRVASPEMALNPLCDPNADFFRSDLHGLIQILQTLGMSRRARTSSPILL